MRRYNSFLGLLVILGLLTGCDLSYTVSSLWICNESGQPLYVESTIKSELTSTDLCFMLEEGEGNMEILAKSARYENMQSYLPLSHCINNQDAKVSIYTVSDGGEKQLVHTWHYSDRDKEGREIFNEKCLSQGGDSTPDGGYFPTFTFTILPEDLN